jgi:ketosteroid isomerase-like protein
MKQCRTFSIAVIIMIAGSLASAWGQDAQEQLKKMEIDRAEAVVKANVAKLDKETSDDYMLINMNGRMADKAAMIEGFKSGSSKITSEELSDLKVRIYGNTGVVTGKADIKGTLGGQDATGQILFTRVYVKKNGHWQSVSLQQTRAANP